MSSEWDKLRRGDILKMDEFYMKNMRMEGDRWAILLEDACPIAGYPNAMIFCRDKEGHWHSEVYHIGGDDKFVHATEDDVPDDVPEDFWPLAARIALGVEE